MAWQQILMTADRRPTPALEPFVATQGKLREGTDETAIASGPSPSVLRPPSEVLTLTDLATLENPYKGLRGWVWCQHQNWSRPSSKMWGNSPGRCRCCSMP